MRAFAIGMRLGLGLAAAAAGAAGAGAAAGCAGPKEERVVGAPSPLPPGARVPAGGPTHRVVVDDERRFWFEVPPDWERRRSGMMSIVHEWRDPAGRVDLRVVLVSTRDARDVARGEMAVHCATVAERLRKDAEPGLSLAVADARKRGAFATCTFLLEYAPGEGGVARVAFHHMAFGSAGIVSLFLETDRASFASLRPVLERILSSFVLA